MGDPFTDVGRAFKSRTTEVINATGVVMHPTLGRSPWSRSAIEAAVRAAGYATEGERPGKAAEERIAAVTATPAATVVNNGTAALMLTLRFLAGGKKVIVARNELVETPDGFNVALVAMESGAELVEIGSANRCTLDDWKRAVDEHEDDVGAVLRVFSQSFQQMGYVETAGLEELARLGPPLVVDLGHGCVSPFFDEPTVSEQYEQGARAITFSGDKMLGGPQCGIIAGLQNIIDGVRAQPMMRMVRPDKVTLAALEATLDDWLFGRAVPVLQILQAEMAHLEHDVRAWRDQLPPYVEAQVTQLRGSPGNVHLPGRTWPSVALVITRPDPERLYTALRAGSPPVIGRLLRRGLVLDSRTVVPLGEGPRMLEALLKALERA